ncbi:MAG: large conductance mechanosensitive channel [Actinomycetota bacterium]|jgi:large conductance mechanosensitive channel|nr:large conductance mechanosensitive channel [Actinomycetota bacterium]
MRGLFDDFKKFILRGNVLDLAVAVIVGAAFNAVVQSLVKNIITPLIGFIFGKPSFNDLVLNLSCTRNANGVKSCKGVVTYGTFITDVVNFLIIAFSVFVIIKTFERLQQMRKGTMEEEAEPLTVDQEILAEIRDILRDRAEPSQPS